LLQVSQAADLAVVAVAVAVVVVVAVAVVVVVAAAFADVAAAASAGAASIEGVHEKADEGLVLSSLVSLHSEVVFVAAGLRFVVVVVVVDVVVVVGLLSRHVLTLQPH